METPLPPALLCLESKGRAWSSDDVALRSPAPRTCLEGPPSGHFLALAGIGCGKQTLPLSAVGPQGANTSVGPFLSCLPFGPGWGLGTSHLLSSHPDWTALGKTGEGWGSTQRGAPDGGRAQDQTPAGAFPTSILGGLAKLGLPWGAGGGEGSAASPGGARRRPYMARSPWLRRNLIPGRAGPGLPGPAPGRASNSPQTPASGAHDPLMGPLVGGPVMKGSTCSSPPPPVRAA